MCLLFQLTQMQEQLSAEKETQMHLAAEKEDLSQQLLRLRHESTIAQSEAHSQHVLLQTKVLKT